VTIGLGVGTFLLVGNDDHAFILHRYGRGSKMITYLEFLMPYCLFTI